MLIRSRIQDHFERVVREDLLTLFGCTASLRSLECSVILQGAAQLSAEAKYRAACIIEILTGQRPTVGSCHLQDEDPMYVRKSEEEQRALDRIKSAIMHRNNQGNVSSADYRALGNGTALRTTLRRIGMFDFLEKAREFYLPDILLLRASNDTTSILSSSLSSELKGEFFGSWNKSKLPGNGRFQGATAADITANTVFILKSSDLLKFPDIEMHFEALGNAFSDVQTQSSASNGPLNLIIRPTMTVNYPLGRRLHSAVLPSLNHFGVFNYLLCKLFNPYIQRPKVSSFKNSNQ